MDDVDIRGGVSVDERCEHQRRVAGGVSAVHLESLLIVFLLNSMMKNGIQLKDLLTVPERCDPTEARQWQGCREILRSAERCWPEMIRW